LRRKPGGRKAGRKAEMSLQLRIIDPPEISGVVMRCVSDEFEIRDRDGRTGRGFTNLKRILGRPADFAIVVDQLARTVPAGHAVAACDEGAWALGGATALKLGVPAVLVRRAPKTYFVAYGDDPAIGDGRLVGASAILWTYRADAAKDELAAAGMTEISCLIHQRSIPRSSVVA
jgi:hypothetical protein